MWDTSFRISKFEEHIKGIVKTIDLANLKWYLANVQGYLDSFDRRMETLEDEFKGMKENLEKYMELMAK